MYYIHKVCVAASSLLCLLCQPSVSERLLDTFRGLWAFASGGFHEVRSITQNFWLPVVTGELWGVEAFGYDLKRSYQLPTYCLNVCTCVDIPTCPYWGQEVEKERDGQFLSFWALHRDHVQAHLVGHFADANRHLAEHRLEARRGARNKRIQKKLLTFRRPLPLPHSLTFVAANYSFYLNQENT